MQRTLYLVVIGILINFCLPSIAQTTVSQTAQVRQTIEKMYKQQGGAFDRKDIDGYFLGTAPNFVYVTKDGKTRTKTQIAQDIMPMWIAAASLQSSIRIKDFQLKGQTATVTAEYITTEHMVNQQTKQPASLVTDDVTKDVWIKTAGKWQQQKAQGFSSVWTFNGKPLPPR